MESRPIPKYPRYTLDADRFTIRCVRPYRANIEPFIVRPWALKNAPNCFFVSLRDENDKVHNVTINRLIALTYEVDAPPLPTDLVEIPSFSNYSFSFLEDVVVVMKNIKRYPFVPHRLKQFRLNRAPLMYSHLRDDAGDRFSLTMNHVKDLVKGITFHEPKDNYDDNLPAFMRRLPYRRGDTVKRIGYTTRRLKEPPDPQSVKVQGTPEPTPPTVATPLVPTTYRRAF
jgi:hypothetical protein